MDRLSPSPPNFADCLTIGEAAEVLGVSAATLRNWDRSGKLKPRRHPQNGYRIYLYEDLNAVLRSAELAEQIDESNPIQVDWSKAGEGDHFVQFYESNEFYAESVGGFVGTALAHGGIAVVVVTAEHRLTVVRKLEADGIDVIAAERDGHLFLRDAETVVSQIMTDGELDRTKFANMVSSVLGNLVESGRRIFGTGEIAGLLWEKGKRAAAIEVEKFWDEFAKRNRMTILCAYSIGKSVDADFQAALAEVCSCHSRVFPAESYPITGDENAQLQSVALLQHKAHALEAEVLHRQQCEQSLREADCRNVEQLATLTHGLRSPLASIRNAIEVLERNAMDASSRNAATDIIRRQVDQLALLVEDLAGPRRRESDRIEL